MYTYIIAMVLRNGSLEHFTVTSDNYNTIPSKLTEYDPKYFRIISESGVRQDDTDKIGRRQKTEYYWTGKK